MAVKFLLDLKPQLGRKNSKECKSCGLCINQPPVVEKGRQSRIFWVGLSSVLFNESQANLPLSPHTRTGALISQIEEAFPKTIGTYKTNLVKCVPLKESKIRYPSKIEMTRCFPNLSTEIQRLKPKLVILLGKQVSSFVLSQYSKKDIQNHTKFGIQLNTIGGVVYASVHHPFIYTNL